MLAARTGEQDALMRNYCHCKFCGDKKSLNFNLVKKKKAFLTPQNGPFMFTDIKAEGQVSLVENLYF